MKRQIALLILAFAVIMLSVQGQNNPDLGIVTVKTEHGQMPFLLEGSGRLALENIIKSYISDEDDNGDDDDNSDALTVIQCTKRGR